jgi:hypothetical protein
VRDRLRPWGSRSRRRAGCIWIVPSSYLINNP